MTEDEFLDGLDDERQPIHPWRWRFVAVWIVIFTIATGYAIRSNRENINELKDAKASVQALQRTNCGLRNFLLTAKQAREKAAQTSTGQIRLDNLQAAAGYKNLLKPFHGRLAVGACPNPPGTRG